MAQVLLAEKEAVTAKVRKLYDPESDTWFEIPEYALFEHEYYNEGTKWQKVYRKEIAKIIKGLQGKEKDVLAYILETYNENTNMFKKKYGQIEKGADVSLRTVARAMVRMQDMNFIRMSKPGEWLINPYMLYKGYRDHQKALYAQFVNLTHRQGK